MSTSKSQQTQPSNGQTTNSNSYLKSLPKGTEFNYRQKRLIALFKYKHKINRVGYWNLNLIKILDIIKDLYEDNYVLLNNSYNNNNKKLQRIAVLREIELDYFSKKVRKCLGISPSNKDCNYDDKPRYSVGSRGLTKGDD